MVRVGEYIFKTVAGGWSLPKDYWFVVTSLKQNFGTTDQGVWSGIMLWQSESGSDHPDPLRKGVWCWKTQHPNISGYKTSLTTPPPPMHQKSIFYKQLLAIWNLKD